MELKKLVITIILVIGLISCGHDSPQLPNYLNNSPQLNHFFTIFADDYEQIDDQIKKYTIKKTNDGLFVKQLPTMRNPKMATVVTYRAMDNNVGVDLKGHMNILEEAGSSKYLNLVAFTDGPSDSDSYKYYIKYDTSDVDIMSPYIYASPTNKELDSGSFETLRETVNWGFSKYESKFKVLDITSHGSGYQGACIDDRSNSIISLPDLGMAIKQGLKGKKLDVINFLACLMGTIEVAYEFRDIAEVMVASEDSIYGGYAGKYYRGTIGKLSGMQIHQEISAQQLAKLFVLEIDPSDPKSRVYTLSAIDLTKISLLKRYMNVLSNNLISKLPQYKKQILNAYNTTPNFDLDEEGWSGHRDLLTFCNNLIKYVPDNTIKQSCSDVIQILNQVLIIVKGKEGIKANGLSIYMPMIGIQDLNKDYLNTKFAKDTSWDTFLIEVLK